MCIAAEEDRLALVIGGLNSANVHLVNVEVYNTFNIAGAHQRKYLIDGNKNVLDEDPDTSAVQRVTKSCGSAHSIPDIPTGINLASAEYMGGKLYFCGGEHGPDTQTTTGQ
jgi:hypothetical protein